VIATDLEVGLYVALVAARHARHELFTVEHLLMRTVQMQKLLRAFSGR